MLRRNTPLNIAMARDKFYVPSIYPADMRQEIWSYFREHIAVISTRGMYRIDRINVILDHCSETIINSSDPIETIKRLYQESLVSDIARAKESELIRDVISDDQTNIEVDRMIADSDLKRGYDESLSIQFSKSYYDDGRANDLIDRYVKLSFTSPINIYKPRWKDKVWRIYWRIRYWFRYLPDKANLFRRKKRDF